MKLSTRLVSAIAGLAAIAALSFTKPADAAPMPKGTFTVSAERLTSLTLEFPQNSSAIFGMNLLFAQTSNTLQFPRIAADYFIIDGLSIGGSVGVSYRNTPGGDTGWWGILPRVGYAFAISSALDFWPRITLGVTGSIGAGSSTFGTVGLEGAFLWKATPNLSVEFGPTLDVLFGNFSTVALGPTAGATYRF
jgi:hypothetical protein